MKRLSWLVTFLLPGCGLVSGLDQLTVEDAACANCADVTTGDASTDVKDAGVSDGGGSGADVVAETSGGPKIHCGTINCSGIEPICCYSPNTPKCAPSSADCTDGSVPLACASAADCPPADVCCGMLGPANGSCVSITSASCTSASQCIPQIGADLCDPVVAPACPANTACTLSNCSLPGYYVCK